MKQSKKIFLGIVMAADTVSYVGFEETEPAVRLDYGVVYEDEALLVVDKPGNLPCHPGGRYFTQTLWHALSAERGGHPCHFVNRIDRETSGLVLIAKTAEVAAACARQFAAGTVDKGYLAAVYGDFPEEPMCADGVLRPDDKSPVRKKQRFIPTGFSGVSAGGSAGAVEGPGSRCRTDFRLRKRAGGLSLVSATPMTGRLHQIRVSLLSLGYPVVGDKIYGPDDTLFIRFIEAIIVSGYLCPKISLISTRQVKFT